MKIIDPQKMFGAFVKASRNLLGITQETLAVRAELHRTYISDVERGDRNPSLKTIIRLAHALEVTISALFPAKLEHWKSEGFRNEDLNRNFVDILLVEDSLDDVEINQPSFALRYGGAFASVAAAIGVRRLLDPWLGEQFPFAVVFLAIMRTA